jgi:peroxiredoxin
MSLQDQLDALKAERYVKTQLPVTLARQRAVGQLLASRLAESAVRAGDRVPSFRLRDGDGTAFSSDDALRLGPVLIVFYRGRWCPYCNLDLSAIELASDKIRSAGASIVAISQQTPAESVQTVRLNGLSFQSLVDRRGRVANAFGLRWKASAELPAVQDGCGGNPAVFNGETSWTFTMPARYIVGADGMVAYADVSIDYTQRGDPSELLPVLDHLRRIRTFAGTRAGSHAGPEPELQKTCPCVPMAHESVPRCAPRWQDPGCEASRRQERPASLRRF